MALALGHRLINLSNLVFKGDPTLLVYGTILLIFYYASLPTCHAYILFLSRCKYKIFFSCLCWMIQFITCSYILYLYTVQFGQHFYTCTCTVRTTFLYSDALKVIFLFTCWPGWRSPSPAPQTDNRTWRSSGSPCSALWPTQSDPPSTGSSWSTCSC